MKKQLAKYGWDIAGIVGFGLAVGGIAGKWGPAIAAIVAGVSIVALYLWTEVHGARGAR